MDWPTYIGKDEIEVPRVQANGTRRHDPISLCKYVVGVNVSVKSWVSKQSGWGLGNVFLDNLKRWSKVWREFMPVRVQNVVCEMIISRESAEVFPIKHVFKSLLPSMT